MNKFIVLIICSIFMLFINKLSAQDELKSYKAKETKADTKTFNIVSLDHKNRMVKIVPDYLNHVLAITCLRDTIRINDYWGVPPDIHLLNKNFIEINYEVRGGSNLGLGNTLVLCVNDGKLYEALHALRYSDWDSGDLKSNYHIRLSLNRDNKNSPKLDVSILDHVQSRRNTVTNYNYNNRTTLSFDTKQNVFYSIKEDIYDVLFLNTTTEKRVKQKIEGNFPVIVLGKESYTYIHSRWYQFGKSNEINEFQ